MLGIAGQTDGCWWPRWVGRRSSSAADAFWRAAGTLQQAPSSLRKLGNPLTSEAAAFRWLVVAAVVVLALTALVLIGRAVL